jgi:diacylglycerol kinase (ATP)
MKSRLIVNPVSGTDTAPDYLQNINERLRAQLGAMDIVMTVAAGDAEHAAEQAVRDGCDHLFVAGGDGTLNEVLNGVGRVEGGFDAVTLGVIPLGTGNDFATALGLPADVDAALDMLLASEPIRVDVGHLNERFFVNVSAGGFIAEVSDAVDPHLKTLAGRLAYILGGAQVLFHYEPVSARIVADEHPDGSASPAPSPRVARVTRDVTLQAFAVCNARLIGGGQLIAPDAVFDDGLLDVCLIHEMSTLEFVGLLRRVSSGDHVDDPRVTYFRTRALECVFGRVIKVNTDGQVLEADHCRYGILPRAVRFLGGGPARPHRDRA